MNRRWQLERTLPANLEALRGTAHFLAVVDYNSGDGAVALLRAHDGAVAAGALTWFRTDEPTEFHASRAKNAAHRLALRRRPDVLFNLDADNFVTADTLRIVEQAFAGGAGCLHEWTGQAWDGSFGRIALRAADWIALGGYDETLWGMGWQDVDLLYRARAAGLRYVHAGGAVTPPVDNTVADKLAYVAARPDGQADALAALREMGHQNLIRSLGRPARLSLDEQRRWHGVLDSGEAVVI